jgi:hypothetical protein
MNNHSSFPAVNKSGVWIKTAIMWFSSHSQIWLVLAQNIISHHESKSFLMENGRLKLYSQNNIRLTEKENFTVLHNGCVMCALKNTINIHNIVKE